MEDYLRLMEKKFRGTVKDLLVKRIKKEHRIFISDTTLRDGEQAPGASLNAEEKLEIARQLDKLGVDSIESGFPISSEEEFKAVRLIAEKIRRPVITALCRCKTTDIDCAKNALADAHRCGLALFTGTSPILRRHSVHKTKRELLDVISGAISYAKKFTDSVVFGAEDASRTEEEFLYEVYERAIKSGAMVVGFADTVGKLVPHEVENIISRIKSNVPSLKDAFLAVHFHDDLGLATANALAAITSGVNIVQCTVNGIGERAGNTSLEEIVMALKTRKDYYKAMLHIDTSRLYKTSQLVSRLTGINTSANKAIVGENVFATEAGIHQAALLKSRLTYEIIRPQDVGQKGTKFVLGRHSGKHAIINRMQELGIKLKGPKKEEETDSICKLFKKMAQTKKVVTDKDLASIVREATKGDGVKNSVYTD